MGTRLSKLWISFAGLWGAAAVAIGAYSTHGLGDDEIRVLWAQTGSAYGLVHVLALLVLTALGQLGKGSQKLGVLACSCFALGLVLFTGGLFVKALADISLGGPFIPVGGSLYILGWLVTAVYGFTFKGKGF
ncbi:hypothetical protein A9Q97_00705 [Rhodospirillales bacterium 47_12_T64]|nr:hypothetical protein A9Q97_00705 [Rhodospirillales bacterium 47_12_T64]